MLHSELVTKSRMKPGCPAPAQLFLFPHTAPNCSFSRSFLEGFVLGPGAAGPLGSSQHFGEQQEEVHLGGGGGASCKLFASTSNGTEWNQSRIMWSASVLPEPALNTNQGASIELKITG